MKSVSKGGKRQTTQHQSQSPREHANLASDLGRERHSHPGWATPRAGPPICLTSGRACASPPGGRARENRKFIQAPSPEIWSETISGGEEVLARKGVACFWATFLEKIFGGVIAIISFR